MKIKNKWKAKKPLYINKKDTRYKKHAKQLKKEGFSDTETWSLYSVIAEFTLPRIKRFKEVKNGYPMGLSEKEWDIILDKIIFSLEWSLDNDDVLNLSKQMTAKKWKKYKDGMDLFSLHFMNLWW